MAFTKGLHDLGNHAWAYLQPDGSWGWSNAGLVTDGDQSLLVDTLFDEHLTAEMLTAMKDATGVGGDEVTTLVNTHANGDHTHGNGLATNAEIIASEASTREMNETPPEMLAALLDNAPNMGEMGEYFQHCFGPFDFAGVNMRLPTKTFSSALTLAVGDKDVHLTEVGPAHTAGDVLVHVPADRVIYTGDILFIEGTPIMWAGPVENWLEACDLILDLDVDHIVPGHGPLTDKAGVRRMRDYLSFVDDKARQCFDAGLSAEDAAFEIDLGEYGNWIDFERIVVSVDALYRGYRGGDEAGLDVVRLFDLMGKLYRDRRGRA